MGALWGDAVGSVAGGLELPGRVGGCIGCIVQGTVVLDDVLGKGGKAVGSVAAVVWVPVPRCSLVAGAGLVACCRVLAQVPVARPAARWLASEGGMGADPLKPGRQTRRLWGPWWR